MNKVRARIYFKGNYDVDAVDNICDRFDESDQWYNEGSVRFIGTSERLQELLRALRTVEPNLDVRTTYYPDSHS